MNITIKGKTYNRVQELPVQKLEFLKRSISGELIAFRQKMSTFTPEDFEKYYIPHVNSLDAQLQFVVSLLKSHK